MFPQPSVFWAVLEQQASHMLLGGCFCLRPLSNKLLAMAASSIGVVGWILTIDFPGLELGQTAWQVLVSCNCVIPSSSFFSLISYLITLKPMNRQRITAATQTTTPRWLVSLYLSFLASLFLII